MAGQSFPEPEQITATEQSFSVAKVQQQDEPRGAAMQGESKAACNLSRVCTAGIHTKAASEGKSKDGMDRLVIWGKVDGIAAETKTQRRAVELRHEHPKPATRLDHGHKVNNAKPKRNCKGQTGCRIAEFFCRLFVDSRYMNQN